MTFEAARVALVTRFELALAAYPTTKPKVQYQNRDLIDTKVQVEPWVSFSIVNLTGKQLDLSNKPMSGQYGQIVLAAMARENTGSSKANLLLDYFLPWLELKELGVVRTHSAMGAKNFVKDGWEGYPLLIPFWWLRVAT